MTVRTTFLGAHALPPEYAGRSQDYIDLVCNDMLPALAAEGLVDAVDVFCERIAFTLAETEQVFRSAQKLGIPVKLHAEQLSDMGGAALAVSVSASSALPGLSTTRATGCWPRWASGRPITALARRAGCCPSRASSSLGNTLMPLTLSISLRRPR